MTTSGMHRRPFEARHLVISIDYGCNNLLMIYKDDIIFPFSKYNELKIYLSIEGEAIKDHMPLSFVRQIHQRKRNKVTS